MSDFKKSGENWALPALASLAGPLMAYLHESGSLPVGASASLEPIVAIVIVAGVGLVVGLRATRRPPRWIGLVAVVTNALIVMLYGFLLVFFGLGGSR